LRAMQSGEGIRKCQVEVELMWYLSSLAEHSCVVPLLVIAIPPANGRSKERDKRVRQKKSSRHQVGMIKKVKDGLLCGFHGFGPL